MHQHAGTSFVEILISLFLLSFILLGLDAMQITALREVKSAYYFAVATTQLSNMHARLEALSCADYSQEFSVWNAENHDVLPQGRGMISAQKIGIFWGKNTENECTHNTTGQSGCLQIPIKI